MADRIGQQLGNYRLVRLLGEGGFAEVYLGEHIYLGTQAAIKLLSMRMTQDDIGQFQQEGRMLANLIHPHIVRVLDFGVEDRQPHLVMDYAPGGSLRTRHSKGSQLPLPTVVEYVQQVAQALQHAHNRKLIHRDVKPENMLIGRAGEILLSDFGIALIAQSSRYQSTKDMAGTIAYMAPEQIEAHPRSASDQYSLGIVAYEWLSGIRPFQGSFTEIAIKHAVTPPPSLLEQVPTLSPEVEQVIFRALAKKPEERFASVSAFATALTQASADATHPTNSAIISPPTPPTAKYTLSAQPTLTSTSAFGRERYDSSLRYPPDQPCIYRGHKGPVSSIAWSPDSKRIASGSYDKTVQLWNVNDGRQIFIYRGHHDEVIAVAWSLDGKGIASGAKDCTVQVWNARDGGKPFIKKHKAIPYSVVWSPNGRHIASGSIEMVQVWDASDGSDFLNKSQSGIVIALAWSPDGKHIASGSDDGTVRVWNASDGRQLFTYSGHRDAVFSIAWSPDGKRIASGSYDSTVRVWNADNGNQSLTYKKHSAEIETVTWSPDGRRIASGSWDHTVQVWNASDGRQLFTYRGHKNEVSSVVWSPNGAYIASGSYDWTIQIWCVP